MIRATERKGVSATMKKRNPCKSQPKPNPDCQPLPGHCQGCGARDDTLVSNIPRDANWPVSFPLQSAVEYMSVNGLQPDTIVTRLKEQLGGRLAHNADSYEKIGANRWSLGVIRKGYRPTWKKRAPVPRSFPGWIPCMPSTFKGRFSSSGWQP